MLFIIKKIEKLISRHIINKYIMSTYLENYDDEAVKFFDYEQRRLKLFIEKMSLPN